MRRIEIFLVCIIFFLIYYLSGCKNSNSDTQSSKKLVDSIKNCTVLEYEVSDSDDLAKFGYVEGENDRSVSVISICLDSGQIYLADDFNKNIKRIDLKSSNFSFSQKLTESNHSKYLNDLGVFNGKLYVTTTENKVYVLSKDLRQTESFLLPSDRSYPIYIMNKNEDSLTFVSEIADSCYTIDKSNRVISSRLLTNSEEVKWIDKFNLSKGVIKDKNLAYRKYGDKDYVTIKSKTILLCQPFEYCENAINLDFDANNMVVFNVDKQKLKIFAYDLK